MLNYQVKYAEAEPLLQKALEIERRVLGEGHVDTSVTLYNLGTTYQNMGKPALAEPFFRKAT